MVLNKVIDNSRFVPYNPYLLLKKKAHINGKAYVLPMAVKYILKYVTKASGNVMDKHQDEYKDKNARQNLCYIGASKF